MSIYSKYIFPHLEVMATRGLTKERATLLKDLEGHVLEIGAGAGQNFPFFPSSIAHAIGVEPSPMLRRKADTKIRDIGETERISVVDGVAEELPWNDGEFDAVISFLVLCSVKDTTRALQEINRVLKKGGRLYLFEHVLAEDPRVARWQNKITPLWKVVGCGCHLNRDTAAELKNAGFDLSGIESFRSPNMGPSITSYVIQGYARKTG